MMTMKHFAASGEEFIYETPYVNFIPSKSESAEPTVWRYDQNGRAYQIVGGIVHVVNSAGVPVQEYFLSSIGPAE